MCRDGGQGWENLQRALLAWPDLTSSSTSQSGSETAWEHRSREERVPAAGQRPAGGRCRRGCKLGVVPKRGAGRWQQQEQRSFVRSRQQQQLQAGVARPSKRLAPGRGHECGAPCHMNLPWPCILPCGLSSLPPHSLPLLVLGPVWSPCCSVCLNCSICWRRCLRRGLMATACWKAARAPALSPTAPQHMPMPEAAAKW